MRDINIMKKRNGFTLIELLLVILLIGILSGVLLGVVDVRGLRAKSRDSQRISDLKKVQTALELYFADHRSYVTAENWIEVRDIPGLSPNYINVLPVDPMRTSKAIASPCSVAAQRNYWYKSPASSPGKYILATHMEVSSSDDASLCSSLTNWSSIAGCNISDPTLFCYGVENPL